MPEGAAGQDTVTAPQSAEKTPLSVAVDRQPKSRIVLTVDVPAPRVDAAYERVLNRVVARSKIEGFRPGRAPRALVESRLGPAALREEVIDLLVPEVIRQALLEQSIDPIETPEVEVLELERGRPARLKATLSVLPAVRLGELGSLHPSFRKVEVTDEMLERRLEELREPVAEITPVEREVRPGDVAVIDVQVEAGGEIVASESRSGVEAEVKDGVLLPELMAILPGAFTGDDRSAELTFPPDYDEPTLAGRKATIKVTVRGVKEKVVPELDDALAKSLSQGKQETVDAYRTAVRQDLETASAELNRVEREQAIVAALVDASAVEVPDALVDRELTSQLESMERTLNRRGLKLDRYLEYNDKTLDGWMAEERPGAEARLRVDLVLAEFARQQGLEPSAEDVDRSIDQQALQDDELKGHEAELKQSPSARRFFGSRLRRQRVLDRLVEVVGGDF